MGVDSNFQECKPTKYLVRLNAVQLPYFFTTLQAFMSDQVRLWTQMIYHTDPPMKD